jgi:hypothetical protein
VDVSTFIFELESDILGGIGGRVEILLANPANRYWMSYADLNAKVGLRLKGVAR